MAYLDYNLDLAENSRWETVSPTAAARASLLYMQEVGHFYAGPRHFTARENYDSYLIKYSISGCGRVEYGGKSWPVPAGSLFWVDCRRPCRYLTEAAAQHWETAWVHFNGPAARMYYETFLKYNHTEPVLQLPEGSVVSHTLQGLLTLDHSGRRQLETDLRAANLLTQLVSECTLGAMHAGVSGAVPPLVVSIQNHLQQSFHLSNSLESLGTRFGLNPCYLQKLFKRHTGQSPAQYCSYLRIARAKTLLRETELPIGEIAHQVGIENFGYFTRLFKKHEGLTPQEYRQTWPRERYEI